MESTSRNFNANVRAALANDALQSALGKIESGFVANRANAAARLPEFDALRDQARDIKDHILDNLDFYLEAFEARVLESGGQVHWASSAADARAAILDICRSVDARTVTKGKSMIAEEIGLNDFLEENGIEPVETDLGEYIIQLRKEPPSHIIAPAIHLVKEQIEEAFRGAHEGMFDSGRSLEEPRALLEEARAVLRQRFLDADVGITGANFLIAATGSTVIVTNEGNGDLTQTLPKIHIVIASLEKVVPTLEDTSTLLRVLARSATGQEFTSYTTFSNGPRRNGDPDGPEQFHVVLLDNGRSEMLGGPVRDVLRCIRCGACMNHCPVYGAVGGHSYGWVYPGPIGAVLTPTLLGLDEGRHLPNASTFCGRCESVCPVRIPLLSLMRHHREQAFEDKLSPAAERTGLGVWAFFARHPALYRFATGLAMRALAWAGRKQGRFSTLPFAGGWTAHRDLPAPQGDTFQRQWSARGGRRR